MNITNTFRNTIIILLVALIGIALRYSFLRSMGPSFCFNFVHDMQFGDRVVKNPVNKGLSLRGVEYFLPETPALQTALAKQGFYVDPYESTGGKVYAGAFFGPSTRSAVMSFQKKYGIEQTGEVNNTTLDKLASLYSCPKAAATSTASK